MVVVESEENQGAAASNLDVYLFFRHYYDRRNGELAHSFYKLSLPDPSATAAACGSVGAIGYESAKHLSPVLEFPFGEYPFHMGCARLGSKFYFLGGHLLQVTSSYNSHGELIVNERDVFPQDVYVFDADDPRTVSGSASGLMNHLLKPGVPMNAGKPEPLVFVAGGKIYVLGGTAQFNLMVDLESKIGGIAPIKLFESFDPSSNRWEVLEDPPINFTIVWLGCTVFNDSKVLVLGHRGGLPLNWSNNKVCLVYDILQRKWHSIANNLANTFRFFNFNAEFVEEEEALYGISRNGLPAKLRLLTGVEEGFENCLRNYIGVVNMSMDNLEDVTVNFFTDPGVLCTRLLRNLRGGLFCFVATGSAVHPAYLGCSDYYVPPDRHTRLVKLSIFRELQSENDEVSGTRSDGGLFKAKLLYSEKYIIKSPFDSSGDLVGCFALNPVKEKEKKMKRKEKKKNKKIKKKNSCSSR